MYIHPLLIDGKRFLLEKNPFEYAEEAVERFWKDRVEQKAWELTAERFEQYNRTLSADEAISLAAKELVPEFLNSDEFLSCYEHDGFHMVEDANQHMVMENGKTEYEMRIFAKEKGLVLVPELTEEELYDSQPEREERE